MARGYVATVMGAAWLIGAGSWAQAADYSGQWVRQADVESRPVGPGPRGWSDMTYDSNRGRLVLFAGSGGSYLNDIWAYQTVADRWTELETNSECDATAMAPPTERDELTFEYDGYNDLYWTFAGSGFACSGSSGTAGAGTTTTKVVDPSLTAIQDDYYRGWTVSANNRKAYVASSEASTGTLHLSTPVSNLGPGTGYRLYAQRGGGTYHYNPINGEWTGFDSPFWGYTGPLPPNRLSPAFAYSSADQALVMYGGKAYKDTWAMDVMTQRWVQMNGPYDSSAPTARSQIQHALVYDRVHDKFILFGGQCSEYACYRQALNDTWTYDLKTNTWTRMNPPVSPPPRLQHNLTYDPHNGVAVLYGGRQGSNAYNDLWVYDLGTDTWTQVATDVAPPARSLTMLAYDEGARRFVLYGGASYRQRDVWHLTLNGGGSGGGGNVPPVADILVEPASGDLDTLFSFDGRGSSDSDGSIVSYGWQFGDGSSGSGATVSHQYGAPGDYTVRLTVTDNAGASNSTTTMVSVADVIEPLELDVTGATLRGVVNDPSVEQVLVNGSPVAVDSSGAFTATVDLTPGVNQVTIEASGSNGSDSRTVVLTVE